MDFLKILRSFEEFLFEAASWLILYPLTLWRIVRSPLAMMAYSDREQSDSTEGRYDDALSPPLLLLITLVLTGAVGAALHVGQPTGGSHLERYLAAAPQNLVLFRSLVFSLIPLVAAAILLRRQGGRLSRDTLRPPFYAQCYLVAPLALAISVGGDIFQRTEGPDVWGVVVMLVGAGWFLTAQARWFARRLSVSVVRGGLMAGAAVVTALVFLLLILIPIALV